MLTAGLSLKPQHYGDAERCTAEGMWFEVHAENYMVAGGPRLACLEAIRARHPLSLHAVGLSLAADQDPDPAHVARLSALVQRFEPSLGPATISGLAVEIDDATGLATRVKSLRLGGSLEPTEPLFWVE